MGNLRPQRIIPITWRQAHDPQEAGQALSTWARPLGIDCGCEDAGGADCSDRKPEALGGLRAGNTVIFRFFAMSSLGMGFQFRTVNSLALAPDTDG